MAMTQREKAQLDDHITREGQWDGGLPEYGDRLFDVTCVIGSVYAARDEGTNPVQAAFRLIADHDSEGVFRFPMHDGGEYVVTVEHHNEKEKDPTR